MNILLIGSGGRESALAWKIAQSPQCENLFAIPGNPGIENIAQNIDIKPSDFESILTFINNNQVELVVVGPEQPLVDGLTDYLTQNKPKDKKLLIVGPNKYAAQLEGSKDFAKQFMQRHNIPTAKYKTFTNQTYNQALEFMKTLSAPYVLKADGLAAGKGVIIEPDFNNAAKILKEMLDGKFGNASASVVIEEFLSGIELSVFVLCDGNGNYVLLPEAKDYKRIYDHDKGPNTGGMGSVSPVPFANQQFMQKVKDQIIIPTVKGLVDDNIEYRGFIFFGLINVNNNPYVIEYNVRMGDPETESVMPRIKSDFVDLLKAAGEGNLKGKTVDFDPRTVATVMKVSGGYPGDYQKGFVINGIEKVENAIVFHAGTKKNADGQILTAGGRVIAVTAYGNDIPSALKIANSNADKITFNGAFNRKDIGLDLI